MIKDLSALDTGKHRREDILALVKHFGITPQNAAQRLDLGHHNVLNQWADADPQTAQDRVDWYSTSDAHIFEGLAWHAQESMRKMREDIAESCRGDVLCYGCGTGTEGLLAVARGCTVHFADFIHILRFVKTRANVWIRLSLQKSWGEFYLDPLMIQSSDRETDPYVTYAPDTFDTIVCLDVLEHLEDPVGIIRNMREWLKPDGLFIGSAPFSETQWCGHLEKNKHLELRSLCRDFGFEKIWVDPLRPNT